MKAKELIYNLRTIFLESGSKMDGYTDQHLMYMLDEARAVLARRRMDKGQNVEQFSQFLDVTPSIVDPKIANEIGTIGNTRVLSLTIPQPIEYKNGEAIFTIGATDGQDSFTKISYSQLRTALHRKYTAETPKWFWFGDKIYIINSEYDSRKKVRVRGVFSQPYLVKIAKSEYLYLDPFNWDYPLSLNDADTVYKLALDSDLGWMDITTQAVAHQQRAQRYAQQQQQNAQAQQTPNPAQ